MKILVVTMDYPAPAGGIQTMTKNLADDLMTAGHEVRVVNFDGRNTNNYRLFRPGDLLPGKATRNAYFRPSNILDPRKALKPSGYREFVYDNLIQRVTDDARRAFRPDLTHITKATLYSAVYQTPEPFIVSCHGEEIVDIYPVQYSLTHAARIHCVSGYAQRLVSQISGDKAPTVVIHNSVSLEQYQGRAERENVVLVCCRLVTRKNVDSVIRAFALLPDAVRQSHRFVVIGDGPEKPSLEALAQELNLPVEFVGEVDDQTKDDWFCRAKLFVLCPKPFTATFEANEEGFGITFIEAQAAGMPVIGSNRGGIPEAVGTGGLLVEEPTDAAEIADKVGRVLSDTALYDRLRDNARERIQQFDRRTTIHKFEQMYREVLAGGARKFPSPPAPLPPGEG